MESVKNFAEKLEEKSAERHRSECECSVSTRIELEIEILRRKVQIAEQKVAEMRKIEEMTCTRNSQVIDPYLSYPKSLSGKCSADSSTMCGNRSAKLKKESGSTMSGKCSADSSTMCRNRSAEPKKESGSTMSGKCSADSSTMCGNRSAKLKKESGSCIVEKTTKSNTEEQETTSRKCSANPAKVATCTTSYCDNEIKWDYYYMFQPFDDEDVVWDGNDEDADWTDDEEEFQNSMQKARSWIPFSNDDGNQPESIVCLPTANTASDTFSNGLSGTISGSPMSGKCSAGLVLDERLAGGCNSRSLSGTVGDGMTGTKSISDVSMAGKCSADVTMSANGLKNAVSSSPASRNCFIEPNKVMQQEPERLTK